MSATLPLHVVAANNQKEFDVKLRWHLKNLPGGETAATFHEVFADRNSTQQTHSRRHRAAIAIAAAAEASVASKTTTESSAGEEGSGKRRAHVRRKHRGDCPKHLMNEMLRQGLEPCPSEVPAEAVSDDRSKLPIPHMVGRGLGTLLTGVRHPMYDGKHFELRGNSEHPNFGQSRKVLNDTVERDGPTYRASRTHHPAPAWLMDEPLVVDTSLQGKKFNRPKYEMKAHMEAVRMMGKALLREFSGAAFK